MPDLNIPAIASQPDNITKAITSSGSKKDNFVFIFKRLGWKI